MAKFNYRDYMKNNPLLNEAQGYNDELDDSLGMKHGKKKQDMKQRRADSENMEKAKGKRKYSGDKSKDKVKESYDNVDEEMDKDMKKEEMNPKKKKMTVKEFKSQIRERILAEMKDDLDEADAVSFRRQNSPSYNANIDGGPVNPVPHKVGRSTVEEEMDDMDEEMKDMDEMRGGRRFEEDDIKAEAEKVDVEDNEDINIDVEKDIDIDDESSESDIEVKSTVPGESSDVSAILGLLTKAQERAEKMGDEKLLDQIGNTITYYTRAHVVKAN